MGCPGGSQKRICLSVQETQVQSLSQEDPLEKEMAILEWVFLPGKSHGQRSLGGYSSWVLKRVEHDSD